MRADEYLGELDLQRLRDRKQAVTQALLGATISVTDTQWQEPSALPGWTRAHVATHIARNADALRRAAEAVVAHAPVELYPRDADMEIERGSERTGLELQVDLDTSAGRLNDVLDEFGPEQWLTPVELGPGQSLPVRVLPIIRLNELELHRVDLDLGYTTAQIPDDIAGWLLAWHLWEPAHPAPVPDIRLRTADGLELGDGEHLITGSRQDLLAWLTGRPFDGVIGGADAIERPLLR